MVRSLVHGIEILELFTEAVPVIGTGEMAKKLEVHRSTASRLAATLAAFGYLSRTETVGRYRLGPRLLELGELAGHEHDLGLVARGELRTLVDTVGETAHVGMLDGQEVISVLVVDGWHSLRLHSQVGKRSPAHCSSLGKALLSCLGDEELVEIFGSSPKLEVRTPKSIKTLHALRADLATTRDRGYSLDDEELEPGLRCLGAPVLDHLGRAIASISVSGPSARMEGKTLDHLKVEVPRVASRISERLGRFRAPLAPPSR